MRYLSPLRYPGGKARLAARLRLLWDAAPMWSDSPDVEVWLEPFAGGAGAALALLDQDVIDEAWLIEANPAVAAWWWTILDSPDRFAARVEATIPTLDGFYRARERVADLMGSHRRSDDPWEDAWAAFTLNRCSFSGLIVPNVGPLGGKGQAGRYRVGSRWNGRALAERVRRVGSLAGRVRLIEGDALEYLESLPDSGLGPEVLTFADPPYVQAGPRLYPWSFGSGEHERLARALTGLAGPWVATYDDRQEVRDLYRGCRVETFAFAHTAGRSHVGTEVAITPSWWGCD